MTDERIIVGMKKISYPNGECLTRSYVHFDMDLFSYNPDSEIINKLLPEIDNAYEALITNGKNGPLFEALDKFLHDTSGGAVVAEGLRETLARDLGKTTNEIEVSLEKTKWFKTTIEYLKKEAHAQQKSDPIRYAESIRQIIDLFGSSKAINLLSANKIELKRSALTALYRIANETPHIKSLIKDKRLKLTIAFELPLVESSKREEIADQLTAFTNYAEQKEFLKTVKECQ